MIWRSRTHALLPIVVSTALLAAPLAVPAQADTADDLRTSFEQFTTTLPGSVQIAVAGAGSTDDPLVLTSKRSSKPAAPVAEPTDSQTQPGKSRCTSVFHVGDSTSVSIDKADHIPTEADRATPQYRRVGAQKVTLDATGGRSIVETVSGNPNAASGVDALLEKGAKGCWVIAMGVNDAANIAVGSQVGATARITMILDKLKGQDVLWPTVVTTDPSNDAYARTNMDRFNAALKSAAARYPNLKVLDFAGQVKPEWIGDDGIHYTSAGSAARNRMIADALAAEFPAETRPAPVPAPRSVVPDVTADSDAPPAWGSIRVPIALAAARANAADTDKVRSAIADSDSGAATELWRDLGSEPGDKVTQVLSELGAKTTTVAGRGDTSYDDLARTTWSVAEQAAFGAGLLCAPDRSLVTSAMMQAPASENGRWGLQNASGRAGVQFVAAHGGWGPVGVNAYSARQLGLVQTAKGLMSVSIAGLADSKSREDAVALVSAATDWLTKNLDGLPAGFCNTSDAAAATRVADNSTTPSEPSSSTEPSSETPEPSVSAEPTSSTAAVAGADPTSSAPTTTSPDSAEPSSSEAPAPTSEAPTPASAPEPTSAPAPTKAPAPVSKPPTAPLSPQSTCKKTVIALDPGHNGDSIEPFDQITGAKMVDYPNGSEDGDVFAVAKIVADTLRQAGGYDVVLLKDSPTASVSYRDRVAKAEEAGAVMGVSIHTSPGFNAVFPQRVGLFREGPTADGSRKRIEFTAADVAARSSLFSGKFARARSAVEGSQVEVKDNSFDGRPPLWSGNIPIISLISTKVPWVYNEFGPASGGGGSYKVNDADLQKYAAGIVDGIKASAPGKQCG